MPADKKKETYEKYYVIEKEDEYTEFKKSTGELKEGISPLPRY